MHRVRLQLVAGLGLGLVLALLAPHFGAVGQYYGGTTSTGTIDDSTVRPGRKVNLTLPGFRANSSATGTFRSHPRPLGTATAGSNGTITTAVTIPADAEAGNHTISYVGINPAGGVHTANVTLRVLAGALPRTGSSAARDIVWAFSLLTAGELLIGAELLVRRRRRLPV